MSFTVVRQGGTYMTTLMRRPRWWRLVERWRWRQMCAEAARAERLEEAGLLDDEETELEWEYGADRAAWAVGVERTLRRERMRADAIDGRPLEWL